MADRAESNKVPTRNEPNSDQEPQRSRGLDDHPTPPHRDEMNRKTAPGGDSAAPSSPAPVANRITATESPTKKACNGLLQHNLPQADICNAANSYSINSSASNCSELGISMPSVPCVAGSSPSRATLPSMASPYSQVIRPFLEKSCHPSEAPTYPALDFEKPESLSRQSAVAVLPSRQIVRGASIVVFAAIAEMRC